MIRDNFQITIKGHIVFLQTFLPYLSPTHKGGTLTAMVVKIESLLVKS